MSDDTIEKIKKDLAFAWDCVEKADRARDRYRRETAVLTDILVERLGEQAAAAWLSEVRARLAAPHCEEIRGGAR